MCTNFKILSFMVLGLCWIAIGNVCFAGVDCTEKYDDCVDDIGCHGNNDPFCENGVNCGVYSEISYTALDACLMTGRSGCNWGDFYCKRAGAGKDK